MGADRGADNLAGRDLSQHRPQADKRDMDHVTNIQLAPQVASATSRRWGALVVAMILVVVPFVVVATTLSRTSDSPAPAEGAARTSTSPSTGPSSAVSIDLGHVICGDCCVGKIWTAIGSMPGVRDIDAKAGNSKFVLFYDRQATDAEKVLAKLVAAGEPDAKLAAVDASDASSERRWVRPAPQKRAR